MSRAGIENLNGPYKHVLRDLLQTGVSFTEAAELFHERTGRTISPASVSKRAAAWGITSPRRPAPEVMAVVGYLVSQRWGDRRIVSEVYRRFGYRIGRNTVRACQAQAAMDGRNGDDPCDLCGDAETGQRYAGFRWDLEGRVCRQCRDELIAEAQHAARERQRKAAQAARRRKEEADAEKAVEAEEERERFAVVLDNSYSARHAEYVAAAALIRAGVFGLPIIDRHFTADDLRGRAVTHWIKTTLAKGRGPLLLAG